MTFAAAVVVLMSTVSCAKKQPLSAEGDLTSLPGYNVHYLVEVAKNGLNPTAYRITLTNTGKKELKFQPQSPNITLIFEPHSFATSLFKEGASGFGADTSGHLQVSTDQNGAVILKPGDKCTLQLPIDDMESNLRHSAHDCQLMIKPIDPDLVQNPGSFTNTFDSQYLKSSVFKIAVP